jgi:hypothetical protein
MKSSSMVNLVLLLSALVASGCAVGTGSDDSDGTSSSGLTGADQADEASGGGGSGSNGADLRNDLPRTAPSHSKMLEVMATSPPSPWKGSGPPPK